MTIEAHWSHYLLFAAKDGEGGIGSWPVFSSLDTVFIKTPKIKRESGALNENIVQNHLNIALLSVF